MTVEVAFPTLTADDLSRLAPCGTVSAVDPGDELFRPGDCGYDFIVILDGSVSVIQRDGAGEVVLATHGAGRFLGELNMLTGPS